MAVSFDYAAAQRSCAQDEVRRGWKAHLILSAGARWTLLAGVGMALVSLGNVLVLMRRPAPSKEPAAA